MANSAQDVPKTKPLKEISFGLRSSGELYQVGQLKLWLLEHLAQDNVSIEELGLAQQRIAEYEALQQQHEHHWLDLTTSDSDLLSSWQACVEANQRWELLRANLTVTNDFNTAHEVAFVHFQPEPLEFINPQDKEAFIAFLRFQQRGAHLKRMQETAQEVYVNEALGLVWNPPYLSYQRRAVPIPASLHNLMSLLIHGNPKYISDLLREILQTTINSVDARQRISKLVCRLNAHLVELLGSPPDTEAQWIRSEGTKDDLCYVLLRPSH